MAATHTRTITRTMARVQGLVAQAQVLLQRTFLATESDLATVRRAIEERWLGSLNVEAFDSKMDGFARVVFSIDWEEHGRQVAVYGPEMATPRSWKGGIAPEIDAATDLFNHYVGVHQGLRKRMVIYWAGGVDVPTAQRVLGTVPAEAISWPENPERFPFKVSGLDEAKVETGFYRFQGE